MRSLYLEAQKRLKHLPDRPVSDADADADKKDIALGESGVLEDLPSSDIFSNDAEIRQAIERVEVITSDLSEELEDNEELLDEEELIVDEQEPIANEKEQVMEKGEQILNEEEQVDDEEMMANKQELMVDEEEQAAYQGEQIRRKSSVNR